MDVETVFHEKSIDNLKKMLISRDTKLQMEAANLINNNLDSIRQKTKNYESTLNYLIMNDLCSYLSEASATLDIQILRKIIYAMEHFSKVCLFYKKSCAPFVTAAFVRAAHLFIEEEQKVNILQSILYFFVELFTRVDEYNLPPVLSKESSYDIIQLLNLLKSLCEMKNKTIDSILLGSKIFHAIISKKKITIEITIKVVESLTTNVELYLKELNEMLIESRMVFDKTENYFTCLFGMICYICIDIIEFCHSLEKRLIIINESKYSKINQNQYHVPMIEKNIECVYKTMKLLAEKMQNYESSMDFRSNEIFLIFLNLFLNEPMLQEMMMEFAKNLLKNNFLVILPRIRTSSNNDNVRQLCQMNLAEILVLLSYRELNVSDWKGGKAEFKRHIYEGLLFYDEDIMTLLQKQFDSYTTSATLDAVLIYLYFSCINSDDRLAILLLPQIVRYILAIPHRNKCPLPVMKCLLLIFAVAITTEKEIKNSNENRLTIRNASYKMATLISYQIEKVYTHNVSVIKWAFSSISVPFYIQYGVLSMWLQNDDSIPPNLKSIAAIWWSLIELISNGSRFILKNVTNALRLCLDENEHDPSVLKVKEALWECLPDTLSIYMENEDKNDDEKLICILDLCSSYVPSNINDATVCRTAILLVTILPMINKNKESLISCILKEVFCLLRISLKQENTIVLSQFINSKMLLQILHDTMKYTNVYLSCMACNILSVLMFYSHTQNFECETTIFIDTKYFIDLLKTEKSENKCVAILRILYTCFKVRHQSELNKKILIDLPLNFEANTATECFLGLYIRIQMTCCKDSRMQSEGAWQCLNQMLKYSSKINNQIIFQKLTSQPWTGYLIIFQLSQNELSKVPMKFLQFVETWLNSINILKEDNNDVSCMKLLDDKCNIFYKPMNFLYHNLNDKEIQDVLPDNKKSIISNILDILKDL